MLEGTIEGEQIGEMRLIYEKLDKAIAGFLSEYDIHCKSGCGTCCEHFIPDITEAEAIYLANFVIENNRVDEVLSRIEGFDKETATGCPLYNKDTPYHCSVYNGRPLICRLFGSTCFVNKEDKPIFKHCKWNDNTKDLRADDISSSVPVMGQYGVAIENVKGNHPDTELIPDALPKAIFKLSLLERYSKESFGDDNDIGA